MSTKSAASSPAPRRHHAHVPRPRASYSCHCCRARRVKCDKVHPICGRCSKDGSTCMYDRPSNTKAKNDRNKRQKSPLLSKKNESPCEIDDNISWGRKTSYGFPSKPSQPNTEKHDTIPGLGYLSLQKGGRSRYVGQTFWAYVGEDNNELETLLQDQDRYRRPETEILPYQPACASCQGVQDESLPLSPALPKHSTNQRRPLWQEDISRNRMKPPVPKSTVQYAHALPKLLEDLPSKQTSDLLYRSFVVSIHSILPLLHLSSFEEEYRRFWDWIKNGKRNGPSTGILAENPSFLPLLFAVLFGGSVSCPNETLHSHFKHTPRAAISSRLCEAAMRTQSLVAFPRNPTIYSLMSFLIVQNLLVREEEPLASCSYISVALRVAQAMGLHRDGGNFGLSPIETESRRRIWWHIIHTDVMTSIPSALPPSCLSDTIYDAKMICELKDSHIGTLTETATFDTQTIYPTSVDSDILDVRLMVAVDRYCITSMLRRILRRQFDTTPLTKHDFLALKEEVDELNSRINARIDQLQRFCNQDTGSEPVSAAGRQNEFREHEDGFDEFAFVEWAQLLLKLMVHKTYCVLYQPLVRDPNHPVWLQVRIDCINHCQEFMQKFLEMCTSDPFRPYHWLYPGLYQPLHAAVVLLSDLLRTPQSSEAKCSMALIDKMFSLISPNDGVVSEDNGVLTERHLSEGGREAWALLRRLRRKAWENMGRDPDILWTEASWDINPAAGSTAPASGEIYSVEPSSTSDLLQTPSIDTFDSSFDLTASCTEGSFEPSEYTEHFAESDPSQFNWMEWDAAMTGSFDLPGI